MSELAPEPAAAQPGLFDPPAAPAAPEPSAPVAPEPQAQESWQGPSQQEWEATQQFLTQVGPVLQEIYGRLPEPPAVPAPEQPGFDPFDPQSVEAYIGNAVQNGVRSAMAPFEPVLGMVAQERGTDMAQQALASLQPTIGAFDEEAAMLVGASLLDVPGVDPMQALASAATWSRDWEAKIRADERTKIQGDQQRVLNAPPAHPSTGTTVVEGNGNAPGLTGQARYRAVVERVLAERNPTFPIG